MFEERKRQQNDTIVHVGRVYALLAVGVLAAASGVYIDMQFLHLGGFATALLGALLFGVARTSNDKSAQAIFLSAAFLQGMSVSPLVHTAKMFYPNELSSACALALSTFASFSITGMLISNNNKTLYLVMAAGSTLSTFWFITLILNLFFQQPMLFDLHIYVGLLMFVGYIVVDTAVMIKRFEETIAYSGRMNYVRPAFDLFSDLFGLFVRILIFLIRRTQQKNSSSMRQSSSSSYQPQQSTYYKREVRRD